MLLEALRALSPVPRAAAPADDLRVIVGRTDHSRDKAGHVDKSGNPWDTITARGEFGPIVMEPSVDGAVTRPTPDEYEDGEEAV